MFYANIPLNIDWQQILLHLFNFVILAFGLYFLLYSPVKNFMAKRKEHYDNLAQEAETKTNDALAKEKEINDRLANLDQEIKDTKLKVNKQIEEFKNEELKNATLEAKDIIKKAEQEALKYKEKAVKEASQEIANIVTEVAEKISTNNTDSASFDDFLDKALAETKK